MNNADIKKAYVRIRKLGEMGIEEPVSEVNDIPVYEFDAIKQMTAGQLDKLPWPAEAKGERLNWVGIGLVNEGRANGTEAMRIIDSR